MTEIKEVKPRTDLIEIGKFLKAKREENSYTLEHISEVTRITLTNLRTIEEGDMENLPGLVFVRGFIRNYAKLLGVDSDWMVEALNQTYGSEYNTPASYDKLSDFNRKDGFWADPKYLVTGLSALAIIVGFVVYLGFNKEQQFSAQKMETIQSIETKPFENKGATVEIRPLAKDASSDKTAKTLVKQIISPLNLVLVGKHNDWISLTVDGKEPVVVKLEKEKKYEFPAEETYELVMTTGKSALLYLNGEEIEVGEGKDEMLYQTKLNKFSLTRMNN